MLNLTLTFDNGPDPETTPFVLDVLARRSLRATFFIVGKKLSMPGGRELARRAHAEGHWIGNHTWTHAVPLGLLKNARVIAEEIRDTQDVIGALTHPHRFFRPFGQGGNLDERLLNPIVVQVLTAERMSCVLWNAIPGDWKDPDGWVERALAQCRAQAWTVMVLHDLPTGAMRNLERFLDATVELGVRFQQDFAPDCVPILDGRIVQPIEGFLTARS
jgi:peptidoglycan-N-acetylglucosamine deacetylase